MINLFNKKKNKADLKSRLLSEYQLISNGCDMGTFECMMFDKAIKQLNANVNPYDVRKWVNLLEKTWNKLA